MEHDLLPYLHILLAIAAILTTLFPILYSISPWWKSWVGRALMLRSVALALLVDTTLVFQFWHPQSILTVIIINMVLYCILIAGSAGTIQTLWYHNYTKVAISPPEDEV